MANCSRDKYPKEFRAKIVTEALDAIENGRSLLEFCGEQKLTFSAVWQWIQAKDPDNFGRVRAMAIGADALVHKALQIADDPNIPSDHKRIMVETRMRLAGKWNARYGERTDINLQVRAAPDFSQMSDAARAELRKALEASVQSPGAGAGQLIDMTPRARDDDSL